MAPPGYHSLRVKRVVAETAEARTFVLEIPDELASVFAYSAGQYCTFRRRDDEGDVLRCYSMSSAPASDRDFAITVKRVPGGAMSNWLIDEVAAGDRLEALPPAGRFVIQDRGAGVVAFCGGSGVTPVFSILKQLLAVGERPIRILYANRDEASVIFRGRLDELAACHPGRLELRHHLDSEAGYLTPQDVAGFVGPLPDSDVYICGPGPFMDIVRAGLAEADVGGSRIFEERFDDPDASRAPGQAEPAAAGGDDVGHGGGHGASTVGASTVTIQIRGKRHVSSYVPGDTILEAARRASLNPPFSCQMGDCASCMALVRVGSATMRANNALTPDEVAGGWVLTCQAVPDGDVVVDYEEL